MIDWVSTFILAVGFADDLRSRKIHNKLLIGLFVISMIPVFAERGCVGTGLGVLWMLFGFALAYPLIRMGAIGAGDGKLFAVFAFTSEPRAIFTVYLYSLVAGVFVGVVRATISGGLLDVLKRTALVAAGRTIKPSTEFNIPYSVALLLGWLTYWAVGGPRSFL